MSLSALGFGILVLLQTALALSDSRLESSDIDEELIDALASMAIAGDQNALNPNNIANMRNTNGEGDGDASLLDYASNNGYPEGWGLREAAELASWAAAPRQFAYKPSDPRFYLPPSSKSKTFDISDNQDEPISLFRSQVPKQSEEIEASRQMRENLMMKHPIPPNQYYMKKSQPEMVRDGGGLINDRRSYSAPAAAQQPNLEEPSSSSNSNNNYNNMNNINKNNTDQSTYEAHPINQNPNYIMASPHDANSPGVITSRLADQSNGGLFSSIYYIAIVAGCSAAAVVGVVAAGICWYRIHERVKAAADVDYPAYGVTGPSKDVSPNGGDRKLAQSAHMYHYQHQKQQMAALQKSPIQGDTQGSGGSDVESEDDNEDGDYTVYECPGLAGLCNTGEMEVKNPLYDDEPTPATPNLVHGNADDTEAAQK